MVKPDADLEKNLSQLITEFIAAPNQRAIDIFNGLVSKKRVSHRFGLTGETYNIMGPFIC